MTSIATNAKIGTSHTPDSWFADFTVPENGADAHWKVVNWNSDNGDVIAIVDPHDICRDLGQDAGRYAMLMAAAPDLLDLVQRMATAFEDSDMRRDLVEEAREAISKAVVP